MKKIAIEGICVVALGLVLGFGLRAMWHFVLHEKIDFGPSTISRHGAESVATRRGTVLWIEVKTDDSTGHTEPGSYFIHLANWDSDLSELLEKWNPEDVAVITGSRPTRRAARQTAERLQAAGIPGIRLLKWEDVR